MKPSWQIRLTSFPLDPGERQATSNPEDNMILLRLLPAHSATSQGDSVMEKLATRRSLVDERVPETQRSRFRLHRQRLAGVKGELTAGKRFLRNLRVFLTDCWLDVVTIIIIIACAGGVSLVPVHC